jgi:hypothetical protein
VSGQHPAHATTTSRSPKSKPLTTAPRAEEQAAGKLAPVETQMRHIDYHVDSTLVAHIDFLRGRLLATRPGAPVHFDDSQSFVIEMDTAVITLSTRDLSDLLNRYVFAFQGSPMHGLKVTTDSGRLKQSGRLHGIPFTVLSDVSLTEGGELRLHPRYIHALGIGVAGLMHTFGLSLQKVANVHKAPGVRIEKDDLLLTPGDMLPPPSTRGRLVAITIKDSSIVLRFGAHGPVTPLKLPIADPPDYMYYQGSTIHFGHLVMTPTDLLILDKEPQDWLDFWLAHYQEQLVAGDSKTTANNGLITTWPDYYRIKAKS